MRRIVMSLLILSAESKFHSCVSTCRRQTCASLASSFTCQELSSLGCDCTGCCNQSTMETPQKVTAVAAVGGAARSQNTPSLYRWLPDHPQVTCIAIPCTPSHWPVLPRALRSAALQTRRPNSVAVLMSHASSMQCARMRTQLSSWVPGWMMAKLSCSSTGLSEQGVPKG